MSNSLLPRDSKGIEETTDDCSEEEYNSTANHPPFHFHQANGQANASRIVIVQLNDHSEQLLFHSHIFPWLRCKRFIARANEKVITKLNNHNHRATYVPVISHSL